MWTLVQRQHEMCQFFGTICSNKFVLLYYELCTIVKYFHWLYALVLKSFWTLDYRGVVGSEPSPI